MKILGVIPARFQSSRFPGKPLADIQGKPMIWWVYQQASKSKLLSEVIVATDDDRIKTVCENYNLKVMMTSSDHPTGTDRLCEVAEKIQADIFVNIQGDEPLIEPDTIDKAIQPMLENQEILVTNLMTKIKNPVDLINPTIPKVITTDGNRGLFLSRGVTPFPKASLDYHYYKQVCVYGFLPQALEHFKNSKRTKIELIEDIEILRFIESGLYVQYIEVDSETVAVDTEEDLKKVRKIFEKKGISYE